MILGDPKTFVWPATKRQPNVDETAAKR